jgi:hypothetical protein
VPLSTLEAHSGLTSRRWIVSPDVRRSPADTVVTFLESPDHPEVTGVSSLAGL